MTHTDPLDQLRQALDIEPSPSFAARVRHQVAAQPARAAWWWPRHMAAAAAAVCLVSVAMNQWSAAVRPSAPATPSRTVAATLPTTPGVKTAAMTTRPRTLPVPAAAPESVFAETLVPDDQRLALNRLLGAIRAGRATVPGVVAEEIVDEDGRRMPQALVIEPLKLELLLGTPGDPNKEPIKEPIK